MYNLLTDRIFRVTTTEGGQDTLTLPGLLAALGQDTIIQFVGLQRHQADVFHVFLSYLGAAVLSRQGLDDPEQEPTFWYHALVDLAGPAGDQAWQLVASTPTEPAFLQPPLPSAAAPSKGKVLPTPDAADCLFVRADHNLKRQRAWRASLDLWVYALVSLQSQSGRVTQHQGVSRIDGAHGSRLIAEITRTLQPGGRWRDAVVRLLVHRQQVLQGAYGFDPQGLVLVWTEPWDGTTGLRLTQLDPFYLEVARRIRLIHHDGMIRARTFGAQAPRIQAQVLKGNVGDAWQPVDRAGKKGPRAWNPEQEQLDAPALRRLLFGENFDLTPLNDLKKFDWSDCEAPMLLLHVSVLFRGQGKTQGFQERTLPIPPSARRVLSSSPAQREPLAKCSKRAVEHAGRMHDALKTAIHAYMNAASSSSPLGHTRRWPGQSQLMDQFVRAWDAAYFPWLWSAVTRDSQEALQDWDYKLYHMARKVLDQAFRILPAPTLQRYHAQIAADRRFSTEVRRWFRDLQLGTCSPHPR